MKCHGLFARPVRYVMYAAGKEIETVRPCVLPKARGDLYGVRMICVSLLLS